jgi:cadherin-like protein
MNFDRAKGASNMNPLSKLGKRVALLTATLALLVGLGAGQASAASSAHLFWGGWYDGIGHASPDGSSTQRAFISGPSNQTFVAANDQYVYWSNLGGNIGRAKVDGSSQEPNLISGLYGAGGIALDETYVYWIESDFGPATIGRAKLDGSEVNSSFITGISTTGGMNGLAVDEQHIYWASRNGGTVGRADINGQNVQGAYVPAHGAGETNGVAVDATHVYWTTRGDGVHNAGIFRAPLADTSTPELIVPAPSDAWLQIAVDSEHLYFSRYSAAGWIGRADLDGTNADFEFISTAGHPNGSYPVGIALAPGATASSNADLAGLSLTEGALAPAFSALTTSYGLQVGYATKNAHLSATLADANATVTVNGTVAASGVAVTVPLVVGPNTLSVVVTAENGTPKTYTLTITRAADTKAPTFTARFLKSKNGRVWVSVKAADISGSGVNKLQLAIRRDRPLPWRKFVVNPSTVTKQHVIWVRVSDVAGNVSAWKKVSLPKAR